METIIIGVDGESRRSRLQVSYLLANYLQLRHDLQDSKKLAEEFRKVYEFTLDPMNEGEIEYFNSSSSYACSASFGEFIKLNMYVCLGLIDNPDIELSLDHVLPDSQIVINLMDFSILPLDRLSPEERLWNKDELFNHMGWGGRISGYIKLNELIEYFGQNVMRRFFGKDVWIKAIDQYKCSQCGFRIFNDPKTDEEYEYIKSRNGLIIHADDRCERITIAPHEIFNDQFKLDKKYDLYLSVHYDTFDDVLEQFDFTYNIINKDLDKAVEWFNKHITEKLNDNTNKQQ